MSGSQAKRVARNPGGSFRGGKRPSAAGPARGASPPRRPSGHRKTRPQAPAARKRRAGERTVASLPLPFGESRDQMFQGSDVEVLGLRVVGHQGRGGLLRIQLELLAEGDAQPLGLEELDQLGLVLQIWAGRVAEAVAGPAVVLVEELDDLAGVIAADAQLGPHLAVEVLGEGLRGLHPHAVEVEVIGVAALREPAPLHLAHPRTHRHCGEGDHVALTGLYRAEEVREAELLLSLLARESEPEELSSGHGVLDDEVLALALAVVVAVNGPGLDQVLALAVVDEAPQIGRAHV